jgi:hypothetical protein
MSREENDFTILPDMVDNLCDSFARELTIALADFSYIKWNDREYVRVLLRGYLEMQPLNHIGPIEGKVFMSLNMTEEQACIIGNAIVEKGLEPEQALVEIIRERNLLKA